MTSPPEPSVGSRPEPPSAPSWRPAVRRWLAPVAPTLGLVALLLALEASVRLTLPRIEPLEAIVASAVQRGDFEDDFHVRIFEADPLLFWRVQADLDRAVWDFTLVSTNGQGLRLPGPVGPKRPGSFRVVTLGDSVTFGYRVPLVFPDRPHAYNPREQPYPLLLLSALRRANPGRTIEVVPLAVPGFSSHQGAAWARSAIPELDPDVVTWCFGWNDVSMRSSSDAVTMPVDAVAVAARSVGIGSQAFLHAARLLPSAAPAPAGPAVPRVAIDDYVAHARETAAMARAAGAIPLVVGPVYRDAVSFAEEAQRLAAHRAALREAMTTDGTPYVEIPELMETAWPGNERLFGELIHPNSVGHRVMADAILAELSRWSLPLRVPARLGDVDPIEPWP